MKPASLTLRRALLLGLLAALLAALAFVLLRAGPLAPVRVTLARVDVGRVEPALFGIGTVEARRSYLVGPTTAGRVRRVVVDVGDTVRAGQLLAEMDPVDLDERVAALEASIARAGSAVSAMEAQRSDVLARKRLAAANAQRYIELGAQDFISAGAVEARLQEQASADAAVGAADANLAAARQELQRLAAERAGLRQQRDNLRLLAPSDGVVTGRDAEPGSTVVAGQAVVRLIEPGSLWVRVRLDQGRSAGLAAGLPASIVLRSRPEPALPGRVARVEAVSDSVTEERVAQVAFDALPTGLSVGELAEVTVRLPVPPDVPVVPAASLKHRPGGAGVWIVDADGLRFTAVRTGAAGLDGRVQVTSGLKPGDTVVVHSEKELAPDMRLRVVEAIGGRQP